MNRLSTPVSRRLLLSARKAAPRLLASLLITPLLAPPGVAAEYVLNPPVRMLSLRLDVRLFPDESELLVRADLQLQAISEQVRSFDLWLNQGFRIDQIRPARGISFHWERDRDPPHFAPTSRALRLELSKPLARGETRRLSLFYRGRIQSLVNGVNIISPGLVELALYAGWFPRIVGGGEFDVKMEVEAPSDMTILSHAEPQKVKHGRRRSHAVFSMRSRLEDVPLLAVPDLRTVERSRDGIRARLHHSDLEDGAVAQILDAMLWIEAHYRAAFDLPAATDRIELFVSPRGGWNYARAPLIIMSREVLRDGVDPGTAAGRLGFVRLAHEIGHLWWRLASNYTYDDWLNEGLAEYSGLSALEARAGADAVRPLLEHYTRRVRDLWGGPSIGVTLRSDPESEVLFFAKAALVLRQLEGVIGKEAFRGTLSEYYRTYQDALPAEADTVAFRRIAERQHGGDLIWFFQRLVYDATLPQIRLDYEVEEIGEGRFRVQGTLRDDAERPGPVPVELVARGEGDELGDHRLRIEGGGATRFSFELPFRPRTVELVGLSRGSPPEPSPSSVTELLRQARQREELGEEVEARSLYEAVLQQERDNFYSLYRLGRLNVAAGDPAAALELHRRAEKTRRGYLEMWGWNLVRIGQILVGQRGIREAESVFRRALKERDYRGSHAAARDGLAAAAVPSGGG